MIANMTNYSFGMEVRLRLEVMASPWKLVLRTGMTK